MDISGWRFRHVSPPQADHRRIAGDEATDRLFGPVPTEDFMKYSFPGHDFPSISNMNMQIYKESLNQVHPGAGIGWVPDEKTMYRPIRDALAGMCRTVIPQKVVPLDFHICASERTGDIEGDYSATPDLVMRRKVDRYDHWGHSLAFIEVKASAYDDPFHLYRRTTTGIKFTEAGVKTWNQIQEYAVLAFRSIPRCFLLAIGIFGDIARLFRWDRSSVLVSEAFDYCTDPTPLVQFILGLDLYANSGIDDTTSISAHAIAATMELDAQYNAAHARSVVPAYDPVYEGRTLADDSTLIYVKQTDGNDIIWHRYLTLGSPIFVARSIFGRATRVWIATRATHIIDDTPVTFDIPGSCVVIKDTWRPNDRPTEGSIYRKIYGDQTEVFGVARYLCDYDVVDDLKDRVHRTLGGLINHIRAQKERAFEELVHHRCVLLSVGIPLSRFTSTRQLMKAIRDAIKGHRNMNAKDVLHRDISVNNIMISADVKAEHGAHGFLIDPELAAIMDIKTIRSELKAITGTYQFTAMARFLIENADHQVWHDLESFFWVTLYIVLLHTDCYVIRFQIRMSGLQYFPKIFGITKMQEAADMRINFLERDMPTLEIVGNAPLTSCIRRLAALVATHYPNSNTAATAAPEDFHRLTYDTVLATIEESLESEDWPSFGDEALSLTDALDDEEDKPTHVTGSKLQEAMRVAEILKQYSAHTRIASYQCKPFSTGTAAQEKRGAPHAAKAEPVEEVIAETPSPDSRSSSKRKSPSSSADRQHEYDEDTELQVKRPHFQTTSPSTVWASYDTLPAAPAPPSNSLKRKSSSIPQRKRHCRTLPHTTPLRTTKAINDAAEKTTHDDSDLLKRTKEIIRDLPRRVQPPRAAKTTHTVVVSVEPWTLRNRRRVNALPTNPGKNTAATTAPTPAVKAESNQVVVDLAPRVVVRRSARKAAKSLA
ncbi:hypothetical protein NEOLEDRAFT_1246569 [Neolentinus lepideus HHB14362 ss-1]|uniref:Fungal-type protein kinase domain-containing protein n=1 Tax=Neolentinus lepideus HHB14362 ss-1 TaxID=1314782 RepID=A0A165MCP8_9AGAM|nr:hypothetical protein NEOLEDRAFT_1246569 [Neolentinus lepideus HHB14362 ss-1]